MAWQQTGQEGKREMRRLYHSEYMGIPAYLMDFGFGGFLGYGKGMPVELVNEELKRCVMSDVGSMK